MWNQKKSGGSSASLSALLLTLGSRDPFGLFHTENSQVPHPAEGEHRPAQCRLMPEVSTVNSPILLGSPRSADINTVRRSRGYTYFPGLCFGIMEVLTLCVLTEFM